MRAKVKKGDWVFIKGAHNIGQDYFDKHFPRGFFGRVIEIRVRYSHFTGKRQQDKIFVRVYGKNGRHHLNTTLEYIKKAEIL